jgi:hypothetical protein
MSPWILQYDLYYFILGVHFTQGHIMTNVSHIKIEEISTKVCDKMQFAHCKHCLTVIERKSQNLRGLHKG